jgi:tetratricopeptide (TPR) repeat protein
MKVILLSLVFFVYFTGFSQKKETDSLFQILQQYTKPKKEYALKAIMLSNKLENSTNQDLKSEILLLKGINQRFLRDTNAIETIKNGLKNKQTHDTTLVKLYHQLGVTYIMLKGDIKKLEEYLKKAEENSRNINNSRILVELYVDLAQLEFKKNNSEKAIFYLNSILGIKEFASDLILSKVYGLFGNIYELNKNIELSREYYRKQIELCDKKEIYKGKAIGLKSLSSTFLERESTTIDSAFYYIKKAESIFEEIGDTYSFNAIKHDLFNYYRFKKDYSEASKLINYIDDTNSLFMAQIAEVVYFNENKVKGENIIAKALEESKTSYDSAYIYQQMLYIYKNDKNYYKALNSLEKHIELYKNIINQKSKNDIEELELKYQTAEKEAQIAQQNLEIEKQKSNRNLALAGIGVLLVITGSGFAYNKQRQKRKEAQKEQELNKLQYNMAQLGLSNINNQINSHDFKNTLTAALTEVQEKAPQSYQHIADLLNITETALYSDSFTDSLKNQFTQIKGLVSLAQNQLFEKIELRIQNHLDEDIQIPRLLLKNLVENSIKHGIKGIQKDASIEVIAKKDDNYINIEVKDDGKGITKDEQIRGKGLTVYHELFTYFNQKNETPASLVIQNVTQGTLAKVAIPINYRYQ